MRELVKSGLSRLSGSTTAVGATLLIYHRIGGGSGDELDLPTESFANQLEMLSRHEVQSLDNALDRLDVGDERPSFVLTFDDGFADVYDHAWPLLRERHLPFTIYLASAYVGGAMRWEGSTAKESGAMGLTWPQLAEMVSSGLCTVGNHTHTHVRPEALTRDELDTCSDQIEQHLGFTPTHFTYPWGIPVPAMEGSLRKRFRSVSTGRLGRNLVGADLMRLRRVPVRRTDPDDFFDAKLRGALGPERAYAAVVSTAKRVGIRG